MQEITDTSPMGASRPGWLAAMLVGGAGPVLALLWLAFAESPASWAQVGGPLVAVGMMGSAMIGAAADGRLRVGMGLGLVVGAALVLLALELGMTARPETLPTALAMFLAGISFAARGALFARSAGARGWWIALAVVAGEAAIIGTAAAMPDRLPDWLLALLPAQWASMAISTALSGRGSLQAGAALIALGGTAAATLLVARLWPARWPYLVMFTTWLALSSLVWHWPASPVAAPVSASPSY